MGVFDDYIATKGLSNAPAGNPMGNVANISPEMMALLPNFLKGAGADTVGKFAELASAPLAAYVSGFSMGNGQYPGKVFSNIPGATDWLGEKMGADVDSPAFIAGTTLSPDLKDLGVIGAKLAANSPALNAVLAGMTAWHGGPHKFDKFDISKIGTGEGAQAYGHGLYFADSPDVAGRYSRLGGVEMRGPAGEVVPIDEGTQWVANELAAQDGDYAKMAAYLDEHAKDYPWPAEIGKSAIKKWKAAGARPVTTGHLYEVDIPDEAIAKMLDWDKPLSEQPEAIQEAIRRLSVDPAQPYDIPLDHDPTGAEIYGMIAAPRQVGQRGASEMLNKAGIPGIKYLDGNSRNAGEGTRNFVVFDDKLPKIVSRNGEKAGAESSQQARNVKNVHDELDSSYRGGHTAPQRNEYHAPLHSLSGNIYPEDIYSAMAWRYYGHGDRALDKQTMKIIQRFRDKPDAKVKVYRAVPSGVSNVINPGDWVTVNRNYAVQHGSGFDDGADILELEVRADELFTDGNSIHEFGYDPK